MRKNPNYSIYYNSVARLFVLGIIPAAMLIYLNYKVNIAKALRPLIFIFDSRAGAMLFVLTTSHVCKCCFMTKQILT